MQVLDLSSDWARVVPDSVILLYLGRLHDCARDGGNTLTRLHELNHAREAKGPGSRYGKSPLGRILVYNVVT